nr:Xaa-Pro peptidase family protein [Haloactinopolyspora alba]
MSDRLERARAAAADSGLDGLLITPGAALRYLTGYDALPLERLTCLVVPVDDAPTLLVPELEEPAARTAVEGADAVTITPWRETEDPVQRAAAMLAGARRVGLDDEIWAEKVLRLRAAMPDTEQVRAGPVVSPLRIRKSADEVDSLRVAGAAIDRVHARMAEWLRPGRREADVARDLAEAIVQEGHRRVDFVIVASGPNAASPHHESGERVVRAADPVVVDIGGTTPDGYCSDETRTYAVGEPGDDFRAAYEALQRAQEAAVRAVAPGVPAAAIDAAARDVLTEAGLGEYFVHRLGHGIGVETHEEPYIMAGNSAGVEKDMAFSIEPGFYVPQRHGARIEDIVLVTDDGAERLNLRPRDLAVLPA